MWHHNLIYSVTSECLVFVVVNSVVVNLSNSLSKLSWSTHLSTQYDIHILSNTFTISQGNALTLFMNTDDWASNEYHVILLYILMRFPHLSFTKMNSFIIYGNIYVVFISVWRTVAVKPAIRCFCTESCPDMAYYYL